MKYPYNGTKYLKEPDTNKVYSMEQEFLGHFGVNVSTPRMWQCGGKDGGDWGGPLIIRRWRDIVDAVYGIGYIEIHAKGYMVEKMRDNENER